MFKIRLLTALVLIALVVWGILALPAYAFAILTAFVMLFGGWEWSAFLGTTVKRIAYIASVLALLFVSYLWIPVEYTLIIGVAWWILVTCALFYIARQPKILAFPKWLIGLSGFYVLVPCWVGLNVLRNLPEGQVYVLVMLILIWVVDSAAYGVGKLWGRHKMAPLISPSKTWEGTFGALAVILLIAGLAVLQGMSVSDLKGVSWTVWEIIWPLLLGFIIWGCCIIGDLFESLFKRSIAIKDSGSLLPGHGGILDRIDSLTMVAPIIAFIMVFI